MKDHRRLATIVFGFAAAVALAGSILPWALVPRPEGSRWLARSGLEGDGIWTAALSGAALALSVFCVWRPGRRSQLFGMLVFAGGVSYIAFLIQSRIVAPWEVGIGLWLTLAGGLSMCGAVVFFTWALNRAPPETTEGPLPVIKP